MGIGRRLERDVDVTLPLMALGDSSVIKSSDSSSRGLSFHLLCFLPFSFDGIDVININSVFPDIAIFPSSAPTRANVRTHGKATLHRLTGGFSL